VVEGEAEGEEEEEEDTVEERERCGGRAGEVWRK